ncbi:MAG: ATP-binding protein [Bacteroidota bacterium]
MTELIESTELNAEQKDYVHTIKQSSESLLGIINDILDFSKIESGHMEVEQAPIYLRGLIEETLSLFAAQSTASGVELLYHIDSHLPLGIMGDALRLKQVLSNLVSNALKFTKDGHVAVRVFAQPSTSFDEAFQLSFSIVDTGIGISEDKQTGLFDAFMQADSSTTRKYGGTGLGLTISRRLVNLMGGDISVASQLGQGSTFTFTIATFSCPSPVDLSQMPKLPAGKKVVIITDLPLRQQMLKEWFATRKVQTVLIDSVEKAISQNPGDAIVLDDRVHTNANWPGFLAWKKDTPLVWLVNNGTDLSSEVRALTDHILHKPVRCCAMDKALEEVLSDPIGSQAKQSAISAEQTRFAERFPLKILVAEDNAVNQKLIFRILHKFGYEADLVSNGKDAVTTALQKDYDVILMDIQMPVLDGLSATQEILANHPKGKLPKIVALTANAMQGDREKYEAAGMNAYISKPFKMEELKNVLKECSLATA